MQFSNDEIKEFKGMWLAEFGEPIDDARALKEAQRLLALMKFATGLVREVDSEPE